MYEWKLSFVNKYNTTETESTNIVLEKKYKEDECLEAFHAPQIDKYSFWSKVFVKKKERGHETFTTKWSFY